jgi:hypothetical protein
MARLRVTRDLQGVQLRMSETFPAYSAGLNKQKMSYKHMVYLTRFLYVRPYAIFTKVAISQKRLQIFLYLFIYLFISTGKPQYIR